MDSTVGEIQYDARIDTKQLKLDAKKADAIASETGDSIGTNVEKGTSKASAALATLAKVGFVAFSAAAVAGFGIATKSAATFESSLSQLRQASGATSDELSQMSGLARQLGKDNSLAGVTASDAAVTMVELSKAGLSVNDTMAASKGVMSLAKAGQIEFSQAATIAASALNAFGLQGKDANKVADALAAGANASQASLGGLADGLQQSATVAKQFKIPLNEMVTSLALFANNGIQGSDAGTSLKTMLIALAKPSKEAATAMKDIGFSAYDAKGNFVGLREMSIRLQKATKNLTAQQKQQTLATIFGTDAFRAAAVLSDNAGMSFDNMATAVGKNGAALEAAAAQMGPFTKMWEGLQNQLSEVGLKIGTALLPALTASGTAISNNIVPAFDALAAVGQKVGEYLVPKLQALWSVVANDLAPVLGKLYNEVIKPLAPLIGVVLVVAVGLLIDILKVAVQGLTIFLDVWLKIVDKAKSAIDWLNQLYQKVAGADKFWATFRKSVDESLGPIDEMLSSIIGMWERLIGKISEATNKMKDFKGVAGSIAKEAGKAALPAPVRGLVNMIPGFAGGTNYAPGGMAMVGENGPELVNLPRGSQVIPNDEIDSLTGGTGIENNIQTINIYKEADGEHWIRRLTQDQEIIGKGLTPQTRYT